MGKHARRNSITDTDVQSLADVYLGDENWIEVPVVKGDFHALPQKVKEYIAENVRVARPKGIYLCDGSEEERSEITEKMVARGLLTPLPKYDNCPHRLKEKITDEDAVQMKTSWSFLARTDPADVARVEGRTFIVTDDKYASVPHVQEGEKGILGQWMAPDKMAAEMDKRLPDCMKGRVMYVIPFSMGPIGSPLSKIGVQLTDFNYVVLSMRVMTHVSADIWDVLGDGDFVRCFHTIGAPRPVQRKIINHWPCDPERVLIAHYPRERRIVSYGSGYGGNSLLGKKCFALRIASSIALDEGWLAEHMLIMSVTNPKGEERFIAAAFPSACGKTNMAMMMPSLPGWTVRCVGDDIAWMRFGADGRLRAINPEAGFFGVAPGTSMKTNPVAMKSCLRDTIFTNVGLTEDGGVFWEGMEGEVSAGTALTSWLGESSTVGGDVRAAHPNSRFCCPAANCPSIHPQWLHPDGVPIDAIVFGGRRPTGVPLVLEAFDWSHGVMIGASLKSEATAAAEHSGKQIMHDPMAMRPFMGYNFGSYLQHWLDLEQPGRQMPKVFHVNWFRRDAAGKFLWPGFGENVRVIDWICQRIAGNEDVATESAVGIIPTPDAIDTAGLGRVDMEQLLSIPKDYWTEDIEETKSFLERQTGIDLPADISEQLCKQQQRIAAI